MHQPAALDGHGLWHDDDQLIALDRRHHGEPDTGVAQGGLNDGATWLESAARLGCFDYGERDAILDGAGGIGALGFDLNGRVGE